MSDGKAVTVKLGTCDSWYQLHSECPGVCLNWHESQSSVPAPAMVTCDWCKGRGRVFMDARDDDGVLCGKCDGSGKLRPVTPQAKPPRQFCQRHLGCELPDNHDGECPQSGEKALEWYRNHQDDAQNAPQPQAKPGVSEPPKCYCVCHSRTSSRPSCLHCHPEHFVNRRDPYCETVEQFEARQASTTAQASAGLSDEEAFNHAKDFMYRCSALRSRPWTVDQLIRLLVGYREFAIAEVRQRDGERIAEAHERAERAIEVVLRETRRAEAAKERIAELERRHNEAMKGVTKVIAERDSLAATLEDVDATLCSCRYAVSTVGCNCDIHAAHRLIAAALASLSPARTEAPE